MLAQPQPGDRYAALNMLSNNMYYGGPQKMAFNSHSQYHYQHPAHHLGAATAGHGPQSFGVTNNVGFSSQPQQSGGFGGIRR